MHQRVCRSILLVVVSFVAACHGPAQTAARAATGSVTGRVICADTNAPARLAGVVLVPVVDARPAPDSGQDRAAGGETPRPPMQVTETGMDGSFVVTGVRPGNYYLVAQKPGYLQPLAAISREQMNKPDVETAKIMERLLTPVSVSANHATQIEARLFRGGAVSGSVLFDDGTPVIGATVRLMKKGSNARWVAFSPAPAQFDRFVKTDDEGRYRVSGIPAGEYLVALSLDVVDTWLGDVFSAESGISINNRYSINAFYGDAFRDRDAKPVKLDERGNAGEVNITVRLSQMHTVSGTLVEAGSGRVVNAGKVALLWKDDRTELVSTHVRGEDNTFHFDYVPEGEYILAVTDAQDVVRTEVSNGKDSFPPTHTEQKLVRSFGKAEQPLLLQGGDLQAVVVPLPPAAASPSKSPSQ